MQKKQRGRPVMSEIDSFRARAWFYYVAFEEADESPFRLQKLFQPEHIYQSEGRPTSSGAWDKYKAGTRLPSAGFDKLGNPHIAERVGKIHPDSFLILNHPLWEALIPRNIQIKQIGKLVSTMELRDKAYYANFFVLRSQSLEVSILAEAGGKIWIDFGDWEAGFLHLSVHAMLLRNETVQVNERALRGIARNLSYILGFASQAPWIAPFYMELYDYMEAHLWKSLFDRFFDRKPANSDLVGWRKTQKYWVR